MKQNRGPIFITNQFYSLLASAEFKALKPMNTRWVSNWIEPM